MKKKKVWILICIFIFVIIIFTMIYIAKINADKKRSMENNLLDGIEVEKPRTKQEEEEYRNTLLKEKEEYVNSEQAKKEREESKGKTYNTNSSDIVPIDDSSTENLQRIVSSAYPEEFARLSAKMQENSGKMSAEELYKLPDTIEFIKLFINTAKTKNLTQEDKNILLNFLKEQSYYFRDNPEIKKQIEEVVGNT